PDPASRLQDGDVHGHSVVVGPDRYPWRHTGWRGRPWQDSVIYEAHAGLCGGYAGLRRRLPEVARLGVTLLELMPIADFPGPRNWGYDGVLPYAPDTAYGTPDELKALIDAAHGLEMGVMLDVVYNHFGPDGNYLHRYAADFFDARADTPWGAAIDYRQQAVQRYFIDNALYWLRKYRFDGLRLDAVHAMGRTDWLAGLAREARAACAQAPAALLARALGEGYVYQGQAAPTRGG
ncbi:alpha-amylase family glycosyl hydrolase, partial [Bordetella pertussis]|uniref:alpha-amylase family glycosyl hydrolase n=1 Tax=Bordetella pertussis TaxID=520 RepID=UPI000B010D64